MRGEFNIESNDNTLFTTARCNNNCIMCCQPPLNNDDIDELFEKNVYFTPSQTGLFRGRKNLIRPDQNGAIW